MSRAVPSKHAACNAHLACMPAPDLPSAGPDLKGSGNRVQQRTEFKLELCSTKEDNDSCGLHPLNLSAANPSTQALVPALRAQEALHGSPQVNRHLSLVNTMMGDGGQIRPNNCGWSEKQAAGMV